MLRGITRREGYILFYYITLFKMGFLFLNKLVTHWGKKDSGNTSGYADLSLLIIHTTHK